jgi:hypothetical protein
MIEREIQGVKRAFEFGMFTIKILSQETGEKTIKNIFDRLAAADAPFWLSFMLACAKSGAKAQGATEEITEYEVSKWMDELGLIETEQLIAELIHTYNVKNSKAPTTGQMIAQ